MAEKIVRHILTYVIVVAKYNWALICVRFTDEREFYYMLNALFIFGINAGNSKNKKILPENI